MARYLVLILLSFFLLTAVTQETGPGRNDGLPDPDDREQRLPGRATEGDRVADPAQEPQQQTSPQERLEDAIEVLKEMQSDRRMRELLERSYGVFIVPDYGEAALIIGSGGGEGVLLLRENGRWTNPAFYQAGSLSAGLQAGVIAGSLALVLVSERAAENFYRAHNFSLSFESGLVMVDRSAWARGDAEEDMDILVWSDTEGLLAELAISMNSIIWQPDANGDYYGRRVSPDQVLSGEVINPYQSDLEQAFLEQN